MKTIKYKFIVTYMHGGVGAISVNTEGMPHLDTIILTSMYGVDNARRWIALIDSVLSGEKRAVDARGEIDEYIRIEPSMTFIKGTESYSFPDIEIKTSDFRGIVESWANALKSFLAAGRKAGVWHGIPTWKENATPKDVMYWDPFTKKTGLLKDTPEGQVWLKQIKAE